MHGVLPVPTALEQPFVLKVGGASIKGVIDRIDPVRVEDSNGRVRTVEAHRL